MELPIAVRLGPPHAGGALVWQVGATGRRVEGGGLGGERTHAQSLGRVVTSGRYVGDLLLQQIYSEGEGRGGGGGEGRERRMYIYSYNYYADNSRPHPAN